MNKDFLQDFLQVLEDARKYRDLIKRSLYLGHEKVVEKGLLSVYAPGTEALKDQVRGEIATALGQRLLADRLIKFSERDGGLDRLHIMGTIEIVTPK